MSKRLKQLKFESIAGFPNVLENPDFHHPQLYSNPTTQIDYRGKWATEHFKNNNPIVLELACGRGEYTLALGRLVTDKNFIGVDLKGNRIFQGANKALKEGLPNVAFLRTRIELIHHFFETGEVDEIWITFPDPFLKPSKSNKRLTSHYFLGLYAHILKLGGNINLKTDSDLLYNFTVHESALHPRFEMVWHESDIYGNNKADEILQTKTYYEGLHLAKGLTIKFVQLKLKNESHG